MVTLLDVSAVAGHHAMPAALLLFGASRVKYFILSKFYIDEGGTK